jgi:hypothetical protein
LFAQLAKSKPQRHTFVFLFRQASESFAPKAPASTRLEAMGLFALSKMLEPVHILSAVLPVLEAADAHASGSVSKAVFNRVMRESISALTTADCDKVMSKHSHFTDSGFPLNLTPHFCCSGAQSLWLRRPNYFPFAS